MPVVSWTLLTSVKSVIINGSKIMMCFVALTHITDRYRQTDRTTVAHVTLAVRCAAIKTYRKQTATEIRY